MVSQPGAGSGESRQSRDRASAKHSVFRFFIQSSTPPINGVTALVDQPQLVAEKVSVDTDTLSDLMRVLVVEDNIISQTVLKRQLMKAGLTCDGEQNPHPAGLPG